MTTSGMTYGDKNGLQDQAKPKKNLPKGLVPPPNGLCGNDGPTDLPNVLLCFRSPKAKKTDDKEKNAAGAKKGGERKQRSKSCELRASILYSGCECEKRNGLQDQCPRSECQGSPECLTRPPTCGPSEFAGGKHLTQKTDDYLRRKREAEEAHKSAKETKAGKQKTQTVPLKSDYDCFPLDLFLTEGGACPLCSKPMDFCPLIAEKMGIVDKKPAKESDKRRDSWDFKNPNADISIGPIVIELPPDCLCP